MATLEAWSNAIEPAMEAAHRIFAGMSWIGMSPAMVEAQLGKPDELTTSDRWTYTRHNGVAGVIRVLQFERGKVTAVDIILTQ